MNDFIDNNTKEVIGLDYILRKIDTITPYGKELKENIEPFKIGEEDLLIKQFAIIERLVKLIKENKFFFKNIKNILHNIKDIRNSTLRAKEGYILSNVELFEIKGFILTLVELSEELKTIEDQLDNSIIINRIVELETLLDPQKTKIKAFYIYDDYSDRLKSIREKKRQIDNKIKIEKKEIKGKLERELSLKIRPDGSILISKNQKEILEKVKNNPNLIYSSETYMNIKFTLKSTPTLYELEKELAAIKEREEEEEQEIRQHLSEKIGFYYNEIIMNTQYIGKLDLMLAKTYMAIGTNSIKPTILKEHRISITNGRHLKVEDILKSNGQEFTPISITLYEGVSCITGANMGGKTVSLKLVGQLCAMAQYGLFVPCTKMETGLHGFIYGSIGDMQSTDKGLSTFGSEISSIKEGLKKADKNGLILIDELARGTNPDEGYAISKAIVNFLKNKKSITLITTHYDNVANSDGVLHYQVVGLSGIDYEELRNKMFSNANSMDLVSQCMDYRLKKVTKDTRVPRDAINIARLMGLEESIVEDAEKILFGTVVKQ
ncbi:hypothetical protein [Proteiniborus sp.]|uniref:lysine 5,6-aminomutase reactivase ATPase KamC n=1 Tax=Proteiniborus sp. TaxID=2079015 RepID=UPI00331B257D